MPLRRRVVQAPLIYSKPAIDYNTQNGEEILDVLSASSVSGLLMQLSKLTEHANDMFTQLQLDMVTSFNRFSSAHNRLQSLSTSVRGMKLEDLSALRPGKLKSATITQQSFSAEDRPRALQQLYNEAMPRPNFEQFNKYERDGANCAHKFSHPGFFFEMWVVAEHQRQEEAAARKKAAKASRKNRKKQGGTAQKRVEVKKVEKKMYSAMGAEFEPSTGGNGEGKPMHRPSSSRNLVDATPGAQGMQQPPSSSTAGGGAGAHDDDDDDEPVAAPPVRPMPVMAPPPPVFAPSMQQQQAPAQGYGVPPPPPPMMGAQTQAYNNTQTTPPPPPPGAPGGFVPPPPPPMQGGAATGFAPPPPPQLFMGGGGAPGVVPPPPPVLNFNSQPLDDGNLGDNYIPQAPVIASYNTQDGDDGPEVTSPSNSLMAQIKMGAQLRKAAPPPPKANDTKSDLLSAIRDAAGNRKLRKVSQVGAKPKPSSGGGGGLEMTVAAILARRQAIESDSEEEEDEDGWDD